MTPPAKKATHTPEQITALVRSFDPGAIQQGRELQMLNPHREDKKRKSFSVHLDTAKWADFADTTGKAKGSGAESLLMFAKGIGRAEARKQLAAVLKSPMAAPIATIPPFVVPLPAAPKGDPGPSESKAGFKQAGSWPYRNASGNPVFWVIRLDPLLGTGKKIRPFHWDAGSQSWKIGDPQGLLPILNLDQLAARPEVAVLICEGEKAAEAGQKHFPGLVATTSPHGATSAAKADWTALAGRTVVIWPDNDDPGKAYAQDVAKRAYDAGATRVSIVPIPGHFEEKWDLADPPPKGANLKALLKESALVQRPKTLADYVLSLSDFQALPIPQRDYLVFPWLAASSLNMVFAARGLGKSWFVHQLALCLARGVKFFDWLVPRECRVLLVDGEMPSAVLQKRFSILAGKALPDGLDILPSESLWQDGNPLNLNDPATQDRFQKMLDARAVKGLKPDLIIIDNLSSLTSGTDENDNGALDGLLHWQMGLRHQGYAVLLVHHAGKGPNGDQRGASRREDLLDTCIRLSAPLNLPEPARGACFEISFSKTRDQRPTPDKLTVALALDNGGEAEWKVIQAMSDDIRVLKAIHDYAPKSQNSLATFLGCTSTTAGKKLGPLLQRKLAEKAPHLISLTAAGIALLAETSHATGQIGRKYAGTPKGGAK